MTTVVSNIFAILNWIAFFGWLFVSYRLLFLFQSRDIASLFKPVKILEGICILEVVRIFLGDLKGNVVLGTVLHAIRLITILETMVRLPNHWTGPFILGSWAITEVCRYPMYMYPTNDYCRSIRMVVPLLTFPIGAFSEAYGAYVVFVAPETPIALKVALSGVLFVNGALGPTMAYPALLKKGLPILGLGKKRKARKEE